MHPYLKPTKVSIRPIIKMFQKNPNSQAISEKKKTIPAKPSLRKKNPAEPSIIIYYLNIILFICFRFTVEL